jgi:hypothetical protein
VDVTGRDEGRALTRFSAIMPRGCLPRSTALVPQASSLRRRTRWNWRSEVTRDMDGRKNALREGKMRMKRMNSEEISRIETGLTVDDVGW